MTLANEMQNVKIALDVVGYTSLVTAGRASTSPAMVLQLLEQMRASQVQPQTLTFNAALHSCQAASSWVATLQIFLEAKAASVRLDSVSCTALLDSLTCSGSFGKLQEILPQIQRQNFTSVLLEPQAAELKLLAGSMKPNLLALAARSANLSLTFEGRRGLAFPLLRRTALGQPKAGLFVERLRRSGLDLNDLERLLDEELAHPFGLGPLLGNLVLEAGSAYLC